jgi:hypothetical protein
VPLNIPQQLFLDQARSDYEIYRHLSRRHPSHRLHYLQMATEKLAKVYFWRNGVFPGFSHHRFEPFLRALDSSGRTDFHRMFGYADARRFAVQKAAIFSLALLLQNLAPGGGNNGPNPEYPWPPNLPTLAPISYNFSEWRLWSETTPGRRLRQFVENLLDYYPVYFR